MKKFRLYDDEGEWTEKNSALETHLGIPDGKGTLRYASIWQAENPESADYGKYIMPVCTIGNWACVDQFDPSKLVDYDPTWNPPSPPFEG